MLASQPENAVGHPDQADTKCLLLPPWAIQTGGYRPGGVHAAPTELVFLLNVHTADGTKEKAVASVGVEVQKGRLMTSRLGEVPVMLPLIGVQLVEKWDGRNLATTYFTYTFPIHWTKNLQNLVRTTETR